MTKLDFDMKMRFQLLFVMAAAFLVNILPGDAFAAAGGGSDAIGSILCIITTALTGVWGKAIATVAVVALGIGLFLGKLSWGLAISTAVGVGMIFGAGQIIGWLSPGGTGASC